MLQPGSAIDDPGEGAKGLPHIGSQLRDPISNPGSLQQRLAPLRRSTVQGGETGLAQPPPGYSYGAKQGLIVGRVGYQPEIRQQVLDLSSLVEADCPDETIGHTSPPKRFFQRAGLRIGAVQDRHLVVSPVRSGTALLQLPHHPLGLVALVSRSDESYRLSTTSPGREGLSDSSAVLGNHPVRRIEYDLGRTIVLLQSDQLGAGEILEKVLHVPYVGSAPAIDRLVVVPH